MQQGYIPSQQPINEHRKRRTQTRSIVEEHTEDSRQQKRKYLPFILITSVVIVALALGLWYFLGNNSSDNSRTLTGFIKAAGKIAHEFGYEEFIAIDGSFSYSKDGEDIYTAYPSNRIDILYTCKTGSDTINNVSVSFDIDKFDAEEALKYMTCFLGVWDSAFDKDEALEVSFDLLEKTISSTTFGEESYSRKTIRHNAYSTFAFEYEDSHYYIFIMSGE